MGLVQEFKEFALKGNVVDMAVGIIIGAAFNKIVTSLVNDVVMPPIGLAIGGVDFTQLQWVLKPEHTAATGEHVAAVAIHYGAFVNTIIEFLIIAMSVFVAVKAMNTLMRRRAAPAAEAP